MVDRDPPPSEAQASEQQQDPERVPWDRSIPLIDEHRERAPLLVATFPLVISVVVGLVYMGGAITRIGQIRDAGYEPRDIFASIPIEQHLGRGLALMLVPSLAWLLLIWAANLFSVPPAPKNREQLEQLEDERKAVLKIMGPIQLALLGLIILLGPLSLLAQIAVGLVAAGGVYAVVFWYPPILRRTRRTVVWVIIPTFTLTYFAAGAFVAPSRLPDVSLRTDRGTTIRGLLLLQTGGEWWVGQSRGRITVVPIDNVRSSQIRSRDRDAEESLRDKIFG